MSEPKSETEHPVVAPTPQSMEEESIRLDNDVIETSSKDTNLEKELAPNLTANQDQYQNLPTGLSLELNHNLLSSDKNKTIMENENVTEVKEEEQEENVQKEEIDGTKVSDDRSKDDHDFDSPAPMVSPSRLSSNKTTGSSSALTFLDQFRLDQQKAARMSRDQENHAKNKLQSYRNINIDVSSFSDDSSVINEKHDQLSIISPDKFLKRKQRKEKKRKEKEKDVKDEQNRFASKDISAGDDFYLKQRKQAEEERARIAFDKRSQQQHSSKVASVGDEFYMKLKKMSDAQRAQMMNLIEESNVSISKCLSMNEEFYKAQKNLTDEDREQLLALIDEQHSYTARGISASDEFHMKQQRLTEEHRLKLLLLVEEQHRYSLKSMGVGDAFYMNLKKLSDEQRAKLLLLVDDQHQYVSKGASWIDDFYFNQKRLSDDERKQLMLLIGEYEGVTTEEGLASIGANISMFDTGHVPQSFVKMKDVKDDISNIPDKLVKDMEVSPEEGNVRKIKDDIEQNIGKDEMDWNNRHKSAKHFDDGIEANQRTASDENTKLDLMVIHSGLQESTIPDKRHTKICGVSRNKVVILLLIIVVGVGAAVGASMVLGGSTSTQSPTSSPSYIPSLEPSPTPSENPTIAPTPFDFDAYIARQRFSLETLYNSTGGEFWDPEERDTWNASDDVCEWASVICYEGSQIVETLNLFAVGLKGTIPTEIFLMGKLKNLLLSTNSLSGNIPTEIGKLSSVTHINLSNNNLTGQIPSELGLLTKVDTITLSRNTLTGTIPTEFSSLTSLQFFTYYENDIDEKLVEDHVLCLLRDTNGGNLSRLWADCDICLSCCSDDANFC